VICPFESRSACLSRQPFASKTRQLRKSCLPRIGRASSRPNSIRRLRFAEDRDAQIPNATQKFTLLETEKRNMQNDELSKLGTRLRGNVMTPGSGEYEAARKVYNGMIDRHPRVIIRCADVASLRGRGGVLETRFFVPQTRTSVTITPDSQTRESVNSITVRAARSPRGGAATTTRGMNHSRLFQLR
jgi:hypothetical protein